MWAMLGGYFHGRDSLIDQRIDGSRLVQGGHAAWMATVAGVVECRSLKVLTALGVPVAGSGVRAAANSH
jgi:hypothetical protein